MDYFNTIPDCVITKGFLEELLKNKFPGNSAESVIFSSHKNWLKSIPKFNLGIPEILTLEQKIR